MSEPNHLNRRHYDRVADALRDACRVQRDLIEALDADGGLWVDPERLRFLAHRASQLCTTAYVFAIDDGV